MFILIRYILLSLLALHSAKSFYLGSFNIQSLGPTKIARPEFVSVVVKVLSKYDIVLIQEIKGCYSKRFSIIELYILIFSFNKTLHKAF